MINAEPTASRKWKCQLLSCVWLFVTPWTIAHQAPLSMGFSRQEDWSGFPSPPPGDLPAPGIEPRCPTLQADSLPSEPPGKPEHLSYSINIKYSVDPKQLTNKRWTEKPNYSWLVKLVYLGTSFGYLHFMNMMFHVSGLWAHHPFCLAWCHPCVPENYYWHMRRTEGPYQQLQMLIGWMNITHKVKMNQVPKWKDSF